MKNPRQTVPLLLVLAATISLAPAGALAQSGTARSGARPAPELSATFGSMWGGNVDTGVGKLRLGTGGSWGLALDIPVMSGTTVELSYTRQDGSLDYDRNGLTTLTDMSVNYWQIGSVRSFPRGRVVPFVMGSLGVTYYSPAQESVTIEEDTYRTEGETRFSLVFGAGFKTYFGEAQRVGLRASFKVLPTFFSSSSGIWFGTGGGGISFSGSAIWQYEVAAGLTVRLGG